MQKMKFMFVKNPFKSILPWGIAFLFLGVFAVKELEFLTSCYGTGCPTLTQAAIFFIVGFLLGYIIECLFNARNWSNDKNENR